MKIWSVLIKCIDRVYACFVFWVHLSLCVYVFVCTSVYVTYIYICPHQESMSLVAAILGYQLYCCYCCCCCRCCYCFIVVTAVVATVAIESTFIHKSTHIQSYNFTHTHTTNWNQNLINIKKWTNQQQQQQQ